MKRAALALFLVVGCTKSEATLATTSASAATSPPPPPPFTGTLTGDRVMGAKGIARPFQPWAEAQAKLEAQMGKATLVKKEKTFAWASAQGDDCFYVEVEKQADGTVGMVMEPMKVSKGGPLMNWDDCLRDAGVRKDPVEDANAAGPPTDGKPIGVGALRDGATKARSKWDKAKVSVRGLYLNVSTSESNGVTYAIVSMTETKGDSKNTTGCSLADPKSAPSKLMQYAPITVQGIVHTRDMISMAGAPSVDVGLDDCAITSK